MVKLTEMCRGIQYMAFMVDVCTVWFYTETEVRIDEIRHRSSAPEKGTLTERGGRKATELTRQPLHAGRAAAVAEGGPRSPSQVGDFFTRDRKELGALENTLSQADIDALMRSLLPANGDELFQGKENTLRDYDFRRPTKFKKDLLRTLVMVHENYARLLQSFFLGSLRTGSQVHVRSTSQYLYAEYTQLLPNPAVVASFKLNPLPGLCLLEMSQNIAYAIIDRVFGGPGSEIQPQRGLSEIELGVIQRAALDMLSPLQEAWRNVADIRPALEAMETNPAFLQTSSPSEVLATITLGVQIGEHNGHVTLVFPYSTVAPVMSKLSPHRWLADDPQASESDAKGLQDSIQEAPVDLTVVLGTTRITAGEFMSLQVGDVIPLQTRVGAELPVFAGTALTYYGYPGVSGTSMAVQITRRAPRQP